MTDRKLYLLSLAIASFGTGWTAHEGRLAATLIGLAMASFSAWCAMDPSSLYDRTWRRWADEQQAPTCPKCDAEIVTITSDYGPNEAVAVILEPCGHRVFADWRGRLTT